MAVKIGSRSRVRLFLLGRLDFILGHIEVFVFGDKISASIKLVTVIYQQNK